MAQIIITRRAITFNEGLFRRSSLTVIETAAG